MTVKKGRYAFGSKACSWPGCGRRVAVGFWGCKAHWERLPAKLREALWRFYRPGQEADMNFSREYLLAAAEAHVWIQRYGGRGDEKGKSAT